MERTNQKTLEELQNNNIPVYSFSRIETINNCLYEAYRTYIIDERKNQINNIYGILGGKIHDVLEGIMNGNNTTNDLLIAMNQELDDMDMLGIEFPKGKDGSDSIRKGWIDDMTHFCKTYIPPKGNFETETFVLYKTPNNHYIQGYIDLTRINKDGSLNIYDYKTSSMYKGEDIKKHGRQLVLYALAKKQQGFDIKSVAWIMLKYVEVSYIGKKTSRSKEDSRITKIIERKNIVKDLESVISTKLQKLGLDELDIEIEVMTAKDKNEIPKLLANEFVIKPYVMKYDITEEIEQDCINYIDSTINMWESLDNNEKNYSPLKFTRINKQGKEIENCFYCTSLCGHSKFCPHLQKYLETRSINNEDDNLF